MRLITIQPIGQSTFRLVQKTTPAAKGVREELDEMETIQHMFRIREDMCDGLRHRRCKVTDDRTDVSGYALECSCDVLFFWRTRR